MQVSGLLEHKGAGVVTVGPDTTVADAAKALTRHRIGALVVSRDGRAIDGVLSERDIVVALAERGAPALDLAVSHLMTAIVVTCEPGTSVEQLMAMMTERRVRHVPVVVGRVLSGIVSIGDVVKHRVGELESETQVLHDYISNGR